MAKDLPYFKFFCSEWNDGDIALEDFKSQGLFINICSYYWSNECSLSILKLKKRFRHSNSDIDYLISEGLIKVVDEYVSISFLDEQKQEREDTSKKNSEAGKKSAEKRRLNKLNNINSTEIKRPLKSGSTKSQPLREEKRREEKKRKENTKDVIPLFKDFMSYAKSKDKDYELKKENIKLKYESWVENGWKDGFNKPIKNWKSKLLNNLQFIPKSYKKQETRL